MTVLTELLMQWRHGRLTLTELREQLRASGDDGLQWVATLDKHIAAGTLDSLLPAQRVDQLAEQNKTQVMQPADFRTPHTSADKTQLMPSTAAVTNEQLFAIPEVQAQAVPVQAVPQPKPPQSSKTDSKNADAADVTEFFRGSSPVEAAHTLIRASSATVVINRSPDDGFDAAKDMGATQVSNTTDISPKTIPLNKRPPENLATPSAHDPSADWLADAFSDSKAAASSASASTGNNPKTQVKTQVITKVITQARPSEVDVFSMVEAEQPAAVTLASEPLVPGTMLKDRFLLKEQIGSGGMGSVFSAIDRRKTEAHDPNPLVAIKVLDGEFARHSKAFITMQREARKAQELAHPNVVTVFDFDRDADRIFITMELLRGRSLEPIIREARKRAPDPAQVISIIKGIAEGLAYAHRKGFVHSDLKPGNIFLTEDNIPKILDFGIARAIPSRRLQEKVRDTFDAGSLGAYTEAYATAEMMSGGEPDPADDVYALALLAYELFTGAHPYKRMGAVKAQQNNLKPAPIKGLKRHEWQLLEDSLAFDRLSRPKDADVFLKRLAGKRPMQKKLVAAVAVLAVASLFFWYQSYKAARPAIPFNQLPAETQQEFTRNMQQGDELWAFYVKDSNMLALQDAATEYAHAYALHPLNRDATQALKKVADAALEAASADADKQRELAQALAARSEFLAEYKPIRKILK
jgi:hypothetical protein